MTRSMLQGRYFEDFKVGDYAHPYARTVADADNVWFTNLTMNTNPVRFALVHHDGALVLGASPRRARPRPKSPE